MPRRRNRQILPLKERIHDGRIFNVSKRNHNVVYLRCQTKFCRGTAKKTGDGEIVLMHVHSSACFADNWCQLKADFKDALKSALKRNYWKLKDLYEMVSEMFPREIKVQLPYNEVLSSLKRWRIAMYPPNPTSLQEMARHLEQPENRRLMEYDIGTLVCQQVIDPNGKVHVLLYDPEFIRDEFRAVTRVFIDATFQTTPGVRDVYQLLTILGVTYDHALPFAHVLMATKTEAAYTAVLTKISTLIDSGGVEVVMTDFEQALRNASKEVFSNAHVTGCNVHYDRALLKKNKKLKLTPLVREDETVKLFIKKLMALAFLPEEKIITAYVDFLSALPPASKTAINRFLRYYKRQWLQVVKPSGFSVHGLSRRTNNVTESYNSVLADRLGNHPSPWTFVVKLCKLTSNTRDDVQSLKNSKKIKRHPRYSTVYKQTELIKAWKQLDSGDLTVGQFLERTAMLKGYLRQRLERLADIPEEDEGVEVDMLETPENIPVVEDPDFDNEALQGLRFDDAQQNDQSNSASDDGAESDEEAWSSDADGGISEISERSVADDASSERNDPHESENDGESRASDDENRRSVADDSSSELDDLQESENDVLEVSAPVSPEEPVREGNRADGRNIPGPEENIDSDAGSQVMGVDDARISEVESDSDDERIIRDDEPEYERENRLGIVRNNDIDNDIGNDIGNDNNIGNNNDIENGNGDGNRDGPTVEEEPRPAVSRSRRKNLRRKRRRQIMKAQQNENVDGIENLPRRPRGHKRRRKTIKNKQGSRCIVCLMNDITHIFIPCGHHCCCVTCATRLNDERHPTCPKCRTPFTQTLRAFIEP